MSVGWLLMEVVGWVPSIKPESQRSMKRSQQQTNTLHSNVFQRNRCEDTEDNNRRQEGEGIGLFSVWSCFENKIQDGKLPKIFPKTQDIPQDFQRYRIGILFMGGVFLSNEKKGDI